MKTNNIRQEEFPINKEPLPIRNFIDEGIKDKIENPLTYCKDTITIDYDDINLLDIFFYYVRSLSIFCEDKGEVKKVLENKSKDLSITLMKSSSKKYGFHLTISYPNNYIENLYIRTILGDDITRIIKDIRRLNRPSLSIDRVFTRKTSYSPEKRIIQRNMKSFEKVDIFHLIGMKKKTLYKIFQGLRDNDFKMLNKVYAHNKKYFSGQNEREG